MAAAADDAGRDLWRELVRAQAVVLPRLHKALRRRQGLSLTEMLVLKSLADAPRGEATMSDLQHQVNLSPAGITRVVTALESRALLSRRRRDGDRRLLYVRATPRGTALSVEARHTVDEVMGRLARDLVKGTDIVVAARVLEALARQGDDDEA